MTEELCSASKAIGDSAPELVELSDEVLFSTIWERLGLSKRDKGGPPAAALTVSARPRPAGSEPLPDPRSRRRHGAPRRRG